MKKTTEVLIGAKTQILELFKDKPVLILDQDEYRKTFPGFGHQIEGDFIFLGDQDVDEDLWVFGGSYNIYWDPLIKDLVMVWVPYPENPVVGITFIIDHLVKRYIKNPTRL